MPVLEKWTQRAKAGRRYAEQESNALLPQCANRKCKSGWLRLWRSRQAPVLESGWTCSAECTHAVVEACVKREMDGRSPGAEQHRHRVPIGLILLEKGWVTPEQLKAALQAQKEAQREAVGGGPAAPRIGEWLVAEAGLDEALLSRALGIQWNAPVFSLGDYRPERLSPLVPRLFIDAFGALPLYVAGGSVLYIAFEDRIDRCVTFALERMTGLSVIPGLMRGSEFSSAHRTMLEAAYPPARLVEAASEEILVRAMTKIVESAKPAEARLIRIREYFWLRLWKQHEAGRRSSLVDRSEVEDVLCSVTSFG